MEISCSSLLCHEELFTPPPSPKHPSPFSLHCNAIQERATAEAEECFHVFQTYLQREDRYAAAGVDGYVDRLRSSPDLFQARFRGVQWMLLAGLHLSLSHRTVFAAVNYFDRFLSASRRSQKWQPWMAELISIACISIASKLEEISHPSFDEYQGRDFETDKKFDPGTIKQMELLVLKALDWKLNCVTSYSYVELLSGQLSSMLMARITDLLIHALCDSNFIEHSPSVVAVSALKHAVKEMAPKTLDLCFTFFDQLMVSVDCEAKINDCSKMIEENLDPL